MKKDLQEKLNELIKEINENGYEVNGKMKLVKSKKKSSEPKKEILVISMEADVRAEYTSIHGWFNNVYKGHINIDNIKEQILDKDTKSVLFVVSEEYFNEDTDEEMEEGVYINGTKLEGVEVPYIDLGAYDIEAIKYNRVNDTTFELDEDFFQGDYETQEDYDLVSSNTSIKIVNKFKKLDYKLVQD